MNVRGKLVNRLSPRRQVVWLLIMLMWTTKRRTRLGKFVPWLTKRNVTKWLPNPKNIIYDLKISFRRYSQTPYIYCYQSTSKTINIYNQFIQSLIYYKYVLAYHNNNNFVIQAFYHNDWRKQSISSLTTCFRAETA